MVQSYTILRYFAKNSATKLPAAELLKKRDLFYDKFFAVYDIDAFDRSIELAAMKVVDSS